MLFDRLSYHRLSMMIGQRGIVIFILRYLIGVSAETEADYGHLEGFIRIDAMLKAEIQLYISHDLYSWLDGENICKIFSEDIPGLRVFRPESNEDARMIQSVIDNNEIAERVWLPTKKTPKTPVTGDFDYYWTGNREVDPALWMSAYIQETDEYHQEPDGSGDCTVLTKEALTGTTHEHLLADYHCEDMARVICAVKELDSLTDFRGDKATAKLSQQGTEATVLEAPDIEPSGAFYEVATVLDMTASVSDIEGDYGQADGFVSGSSRGIEPSGVYVDKTTYIWIDSSLGLAEDVMVSTVESYVESRWRYTQMATASVEEHPTSSEQEVTNVDEGLSRTQGTPIENGGTTQSGQGSAQNGTAEAGQDSGDTNPSDFILVKVCPCACTNMTKEFGAFSDLQTSALTSKIKRTLSVDVTNTSYVNRRMTSAKDSRVTARVAGFVALCIIVTSLTLVVMMDMRNICPAK